MIKHLPFPDIDRNCVPIFATTFSIRMGDMSIRRHQVPISPAVALTECKVQGSTYRKAVLDLRWQCETSKKEASHKRYCSVYVQLLRNFEQEPL